MNNVAKANVNSFFNNLIEDLYKQPNFVVKKVTQAGEHTYVQNGDLSYFTLTEDLMSNFCNDLNVGEGSVFNVHLTDVSPIAIGFNNDKDYMNIALEVLEIFVVTSDHSKYVVLSEGVLLYSTVEHLFSEEGENYGVTIGNSSISVSF